MGRAAFEKYRQEKIGDIEAALDGYGLPGAPEAKLHPRRTEYSVLLIHGLNDSAYYMRDIAATLHEQGFNTVSILLPGHATRPEDMLGVTAEQWRAEVQKGLEMASMVGQRVTVGGFSLGAALSLDAMLNGNDVHGLFLISPPFSLRSDFFQAYAGLTCLSGIDSITMQNDLPNNPVRYKFRTANGVCQTYRIMQNNAAIANRGYSAFASQMEKVRRLGAQVTIPTFVAMTYEDIRVSPEGILVFTSAVEAPVVLATFGKPSLRLLAENGLSDKVVHVSDDPLAHSHLLLDSNPYNGQENPHFDKLRHVLTSHVRDNFGNDSSEHGRGTEKTFRSPDQFPVAQLGTMR